MKKPRSMSEVINGSDDYGKLLAVADKSRKRRKRDVPAPPIGHFLALNLFDGVNYVDTMFVNGIDICNSHTIIHIDDKISETYPVAVESEDRDHVRQKIYYKNNTSIEIIRIS